MQRQGASDRSFICFLQAAPELPAGYVRSASRVADRRIILAGYRLADLLETVFGN